MSASHVIAWILLSLGSVVGIAGVLIPGIPGAGLIFFAALAHKLLIPEVLSWWTVAVVGVGAACSMAIDIMGSVVGARWGGATKWGIFGALGGLIVGGLLFSLPGLVFGPMVGAFGAEMILAGKSMRAATKAGVGAGLGLAASSALRFGLAIVLVTVLAVNVFLSL